VFSSDFYEENQELGLTREETMEILNNPDKMQEERYDDLALRLFLKKENRGDSYALILGQVRNNELHLLLPLRVPLDLFPNIGLLEPLMVLVLIVQGCGLTLRIGRRLGKFIFQEEVPLSLDGSDLVKIANPYNHPFILHVSVKVVETPNGPVARCALAFCIDKRVYRSWLSSKPQIIPSPRPSKDLPITRIIRPESVNQVVDRWASEKDSKKRFNLIEMSLALQIIRKVMGENWYRKVFRRYSPGTEISDKEYKRLVKSSSVHPLSEALWSGQPRNYLRIISLATFINQLWRDDDTNNLSEKIRELRQYSFIHAYYELKIAASLDRVFPITFIKREKGLRTPDFRVDSDDGFAFCECKRKEAPGFHIDSAINDAASQIESYGGSGIIFLEVLPEVDSAEAKTMLDRASVLLENRPAASMLVLTSEEFTEVFDAVSFDTNYWGMVNKKARFKLPEMIRKAVAFQDPIMWFPLSQML
jgi:hypothetical protein